MRLCAAPGFNRSRNGNQRGGRFNSRIVCIVAGRDRRYDSNIADTGTGWRPNPEVRVAQQILQTLDLRSFMPSVTACPGCGRTTSEYFQYLAAGIESYLRENMPGWKLQYPGVEAMKVAVMGCVVNGPGESKHADIGISLPGTGEAPIAIVHVDGSKFTTLRGENIAEEFQNILQDYVANHYHPMKQSEHTLN